MPIKTVFTTSIESYSILDENGQFDTKLGKNVIPIEDAVKLYEHMRLCRTYDEIAFKLQRSGRMGTYPQNLGQEAASTGVAYALEDRDWIVPSYRENAALFWRGMPMEDLLLYWMGDERGNELPEGMRILPLSVPIGTQALHAVGLAWAGKIKKEGCVAAAFFGDGGSSEGDVHEAINFATTLKLPVIFCCQNNGWAISTPTPKNVAAPTVAQRGLASGAHCVQCDGNDIYAVVKVMKDAVKRARENNEATFVEMVTYRMGDHTTADDAKRYRDPAILTEWENRDPMRRLRLHLENEKAWNEKKEEESKEKAMKAVLSAVKRAESTAPSHTNDIFDNTFETLPKDLIRQRDTMRTTSLSIG